MSGSVNYGCYQITTLIILTFVAITGSIAQSNIFKQALIQQSHEDGTPAEIRFKPNSNKISLDVFLNSYRNKFIISPDLTFRTLSIHKDALGQIHHRISQSFRGIEIPQIQMLVHEKNGSVIYAHGKFIHGLKIDTTLVISEQQALQFALHRVNAKKYMWENHKNEAFIKQWKKDPKASFYP